MAFVRRLRPSVDSFIGAMAVVAAGMALLACGDNKATATDACVDNCGIDAPLDAARTDAPPDANLLMPTTLAETGLCADAACTQINPGILAYTPRWQLFTDNATKKRWIYLPPGSQIDSTEMNYWRFPVGTKLWKDFTRDGIRVETRFMMKVGPADANWFYMAYGWNAAQDATVARPAGEQNANGTQHDIPGRGACRQCHERTSGRALGFSALQLDVPAASNEVSLSYLLANSLLTVAPTGVGTTKFPLPGTAREQNALGYLHANCGSCHNPRSDVIDARPIQLMLQTDRLGTLADTPVYSTAVGEVGAAINGVTTLITPGDTDGSASVLMLRFNSLNAGIRMPLLGTETIDQPGLALLLTWIASIPPL
ncbi:MAG: hypothetical protein KBG15_13625 [Kofleriaceae bacterium]|nr:hypothetical protein [Kofleriaceae bacterium]